MRSDIVKKGATRCAHRSLFHAMGYGPEDLQKPLIGICNSFNEIIPGHIHLREIAQAAKLGVAAAGGTPIEFPAIGVCDGIAMGHTGMKYSLASRELIADSIEAVAMASGFDGLVLIPNCDKVVPGMLMAAARLNIPAVVVSGGPMLPGRFHGHDVSVSQAFEAAGKFAAGQMDAAEMADLESKCCPGCGSCAGLFTANTMNSLTEVLGMGLPGNGTIPAAYTGARRLLAKRAGAAVLDLIKKDIKPRDIMTREAFENAITVDMGIGGSSNTVLHLTAIAHEAGIELRGTEVRSLRERACQITDAFCLIRGGQVWLHGVHIHPYSNGSIFNVDPDRKRRLLLHRRQIDYLDGKLRTKGMALVPLELYFDEHNRVKLIVGLGRGKKLYDKRADMAKRDMDREIQRALKERSR